MNQFTYSLVMMFGLSFMAVGFFVFLYFLIKEMKK